MVFRESNRLTNALNKGATLCSGFYPAHVTMGMRLYHNLYLNRFFSVSKGH